MTRKKRGSTKPKNTKIRVPKASTENEGSQLNESAMKVPLDNTNEVLEQHSPAAPFQSSPGPHASSAGFFPGSSNVGVSGSRFNNIQGNQYNVNVTINVIAGSSDTSIPLIRESVQDLMTALQSHAAANSTTAQPAVTRLTSPDNGKEIYVRQLLVKKRGIPLWIPEPDKLLPTAYRRHGINIGDVGIFTPSGGFSFLFNICKSADDPINPPILPEDFSPIYLSPPPTSRRQDTEFKSNSYITSSTIERVDNDTPFPGLSFCTSSAEGAILTLPEGAMSFDLENVPRFRAYAKANLEKWYRYVNGPLLGHGAKNGEVHLVTGCDKTQTWGMAAVANMTQQTHSLKFRSLKDSLNPSNTHLYRWEYSGLAEARVGPEPSEIEHLRDTGSPAITSDDEYCNQCVFVRTLTLTFDDEVFKAINRDIEVKQEEQYRQQFAYKGDKTSSSGGHVDASTQTSGSGIDEGSSSPSSAQDSSLQTNLDQGQSTVGQSTVPQLRSERIRTYASPTASKFHPAEAVNKALLERAPKSRLAITEDFNWSCVLTEHDTTMPATDDLIARVFEAHDIKEENGVVSLELKDVDLLRKHSSPGIIAKETFDQLLQGRSASQTEHCEPLIYSADDLAPQSPVSVSPGSSPPPSPYQSLQSYPSLPSGTKEYMAEPYLEQPANSGMHQINAGYNYDGPQYPWLVSLSHDKNIFRPSPAGSLSSFGNSPHSALSQNRDFFPPANAGEQGQWATSEVAVASSTVSIDIHTSFPPASAYFGEEDSQFASQYIPENIPRHSDIMTNDKRNLLHLMGIFISNDLDSTEVSRQFTQELCDSLTNSIHPDMKMQSLMGRLWGRPTKANVSSEAGMVPIEHRRKVVANFFCELRGVCGASFTRKNGLINHYKAHLGITDKHCKFCGQAFTTSVGRHEKKCKRNPEYYEQKQTLPMLMAPGPMY